MCEGKTDKSAPTSHQRPDEGKLPTMANVTGFGRSQAKEGGLGEWEAEEQLHDGVGDLFGSSQTEEEVGRESHT